MDNGPVSYHLAGWAPPVGIEYVIDLVAGFAAATISVVATIVILATRRWVEREAPDRTGPFYGLLMLLLAGFLGIVVTGDLFNLFVFIEISSLAAYALIFLGGRGGMIAAFRYLILGTIGGSLYLLGVGFLYFHTGTLNMVEMQMFLTEDATGRSVAAGAVFIFTGLALKMAVVPLHLWLPDAYTFAPSSVNSLIAPVMTKTAAIAIIRMFLSVFPDGYLTDLVPVADALVALGLIGVMFGSIVAISQRDIRRMLAYSSISQLAMIAVGIGLATPLGLIAALLHILNHAVMKSTLFLAAGAVRYRTGSSSVDGFLNMGRTMPLTMIGFTLASLAMVGIPPFSGFFSKWYLVQAGLETGQWLVIAVVLASTLLTAVYLFKVLEIAYLRPAQPEPSHDDSLSETHDDSHARAAAHRSQTEAEAVAQPSVREAPMSMAVPILILGIASFVLGIFNAFIVNNVLRPGV